MRVFVDTSVLFSAIFSPNGHARDLLTLAGQDALTLVVSQDVLDETERNLLKKSPGKIPLFMTLIAVLEPEIVEDPTPEEVAAAASSGSLPFTAASIYLRHTHFLSICTFALSVSNRCIRWWGNS